MQILRKIGTVWRRLARDERGNVALLTAGAMVALLGMLALVADVGVVYVQRQHLYAALDSGALAGIQRILFGQQDAQSTAQQYVQRNGETATSIIANPARLRIDLAGSKTVPLSFARILGYKTSVVTAHVTATAGVTVGAENVVPIGVPSQTFTYGKVYDLSENAGNGQQGNYNFLDFASLDTGSGVGSGKTSHGASELGHLIESGYPDMLYIGEKVMTKPGINHGPVSNAITARINADSANASCNSFQTVASGCHRILYLPVVDSLDVNGKKPVTIVGFAAFYLDGMYATGGGNGSDVIQGTFIRTIMPGEMGTGTDYGVYSVKLTH